MGLPKFIFLFNNNIVTIVAVLRTSTIIYDKQEVKVILLREEHDDFSFWHYLTSNPHCTLIFHRNRPILAFKSFLGHFSLKSLKNDPQGFGSENFS